MADRGILWKFRRITPLNKITNVDVTRGPLERFLGIGHIGIFTPSTGSAFPETTLVGVDDPLKVRDEIMRLVNESKDHGNQEPKISDSSEVLSEILQTLKKIESHLNRDA